MILVVKINAIVIKATIFIALILGLHFDSFSQTVKEFIAQALELVEKEEYNHALSVYDEALQKNPKDAILHVLKGELITKFNDRLTTDQQIYERAVLEFDYAIVIDSTFSPAYSSRGFLNLVNQKYDLAIKDFTTVLRLTKGDDKKQFNALADRANAKFYIKDYSGASDDYNLALKINPGDTRIQVNLGALYVNMKKFDEAEKKFNQVLKSDEKNIDALNNLAALYITLEKMEKAIPLLEKAIQIAPDQAEIYNNLGLAKIKLGQFEEGMKEVNKSLALYPGDPYAYKHRAMAYIGLGKNEEACRDLVEANQLGYSTSFDDEVNKMIDENCKRK